jgi:hypothetical protein
VARKVPWLSESNPTSLQRPCYYSTAVGSWITISVKSLSGATASPHRIRSAEPK